MQIDLVLSLKSFF